MDAIYLLILAVLYGATHALVWAFERLGKTSWRSYTAWRGCSRCFCSATCCTHCCARRSS